MSSAPHPARTLRLVPAPLPTGEDQADAFFLAGGDPAEWLEEICTWELGTAQAETRLYVLPRAAEDRSPAGALVLLPGGCPVSKTNRGQPYQVRAGCLYLPLAARLEPPVSDEELTRLCLAEGTVVFHPGVGARAFRAEDALRLSALLLPPERAAEHWTGAYPGLPPNDRLRSVRLETPTDLETLFGDAAREIGAAGADPAELPPVPNEPGNGPAEALARRVRAALARLALGMTGILPRNAPSPTWVNRLEKWAGAHLDRLTGELSQLRHQELHRLLHELEQNPEQGLRHAIPLANLLRDRGRAGSSGKLGERDPNFRLGQLAGGQASDSWQVPPDLHGRLREHYRRLANEETRLGRHRRAAYIHAELLGDLLSAAVCLKQGHHFHEAAVLYRDHLRRPLEAAECFAAGNELAEAIGLFEEGHQYLRVAELCTKLGDETRAASAFRREVDRLVTAEDRLAAARLLSTRLAAPAEAVNLLRNGWPGSKQAGRCLENAFELLGSGGQHTEAREFLTELAATPPAAGQAASLARQMATVQTTYPDIAVRHMALDLARMTVAGRLPMADSAEIRSLLEVLYRTAPEDRLLVRDGNRYLAERLAREKQLAAAPPRPATQLPLAFPRQASRVGGFRLPPGMRWQQARGGGDHFYAAGHTPGHVDLVRAGWDGFQQLVRWGQIEVSSDHGARPMLLEGPGEAGGLILCAFAGSGHHPTAHLSPRRFPVGDRPWARAVDGGQPAWWPDPVLAATYAADGTLWLLHAVRNEGGAAPVELVLSCRGSDGGIYSQMLMLVPEQAIGRLASGEASAHLATVGTHLLAAGLNRLLIHAGAAGWRELEFDSNIVGLVPTLPLARAGCVVRLEGGVALVWLDNLADVQTVAVHVAHPLAAFTRAGTLAVLAADGGEGHVYDIARRGVVPALDFACQGRAVALLPTGERTGFAVVGENGAVELYKA